MCVNCCIIIIIEDLKTRTDRTINKASVRIIERMPPAFPLANLKMEVNDTENVTVDVNHNHLPVKRPRTPSSPNPLDNEILKRHSPGLSAFGDYVDLVKRHLMYAVREEVEILKQQIGEMMERIGQLEYENTVLRSEAKPETLSKLLQPRVTQTSQTALPGQTTSILIAANLQQPQQTSSQPASQPQASQQVAQPTSQQQHTLQTPLSQTGQSSST